MNLIGMTLNGEMKVRGTEALWEYQVKANQGAFLPSKNTFINCQGYLLYFPACSYFPNGDRSLFYQVPHSLRGFEGKGEKGSKIRTCYTLCIPFDGPGGVLHDGNLFIVSIGGFLRQRGKSIPRQPTDLLSYLDFNDKKIKYTKRLPFKRLR